MWSRKLNCANRSTKRRSVAGSTRSAPLMMPSTPPRSSPAMSLVGGLAGGQVEGEVRRRRQTCAYCSASACIHLAGRSRNATGLVSSA